MRSFLLAVFVTAFVLPSLMAQKSSELPKSVNLAPEFQKLGLPAREQGDRDTCSLSAVTGAASFELARENPKKAHQLSEEFLIWAGNEASGAKGDQAMFYKAVMGLNSLGICSDTQMPYEAKSDPARKPSTAALKEARANAHRWEVHWIKRWDVTQQLSETQLHEIRHAIAEGFPVVCGLRWPKKGSDLIDVSAVDKVFDGHSILLVGYEDDAKRPGGGVFVFRNSAGPKWGNDGYSQMSYAYVRTYANDSMWLKLGASGSEIPSVRFEAEDLPVTASVKATAAAQDMASFGAPMWSGGKHLLCQVESGGFIELTFHVKQGGKYRVRVLATAAPDFGIVRVSFAGKVEGNFDLYSGRISPAGPLELGTHELAPGKHTIRFTAAGKNAGSKGHSFGIDTIDMFALKP